MEGRDADRFTAYVKHVAGLSIGASNKSVRRVRAAALLKQHPDLDVWMARPAPARIADLQRTGAWPFVIWCMVDGHLPGDLDLLVGKPEGVQVSPIWDAAHPGERVRAAETAGALGWSENWVETLTRHTLPVVCVWAAKSLDELTVEDLTGCADALTASAYLSAYVRRKVLMRLYSIWQICYQLGTISQPARQHNTNGRTATQLTAAMISQPYLRREVVRYAEAVSTVLRPSSVNSRMKAIYVFCNWLAEQHPDVQQLDQLERTAHIEPYLSWARTRPWRGSNSGGRTISLTQFQHDVMDLRAFFEDIGVWGWASQPKRRLVFLSDLPRLPEPMPRALPPVKDHALMAEVAKLEDAFARTGLLILRATGMRVGELLELELGCVANFGNNGTWLKVPLGKLGTERMVPLEATGKDAIDAWIAARGAQRALPHPRTGRPADFVFMQRGRRISAFGLTKGLNVAAAAAGLTRPDGSPVHLTPHILRHTFGTSLINAGISLPALMALMGHVKPEMTLRYARLASPTVRMAYDAAMGKVKAFAPLAVVGTGRTAAVPSRVEWLRSEMLKTRVAHGYCARELVAEACPYANICEQCDNYVPAAEFATVLQDQLGDVRLLKADAEARGWDSEADRHGRVITALKEHLRRVDVAPTEEASS
ncbi:MAG: tyrosine-type recombinase/integrase [Candidatus Dormibacterales bacterium]